MGNPIVFLQSASVCITNIIFINTLEEFLRYLAHLVVRFGSNFIINETINSSYNSTEV